MRGEFNGVWSETWREIWAPLSEQEGVPADVFCELYRELTGSLRVKPSIEQLANFIDNPAQALEAFQAVTSEDIDGEAKLTRFHEAVHDILDDLGGDAISNAYFVLLQRFLEKYNLRYDLRRPCILSPTVPGLFASLFRDLRLTTSKNGHLTALMAEFEHAVRDLRHERSEGRIKTCIHKQFNLLEALGADSVGLEGGDPGLFNAD